MHLISLLRVKRGAGEETDWAGVDGGDREEEEYTCTALCAVAT